jgi:hypothetical protein
MTVGIRGARRAGRTRHREGRTRHLCCDMARAGSRRCRHRRSGGRPGLAGRTQATGGLRGAGCSPAPRSRSSISRATLRDVAAVAPGLGHDGNAPGGCEPPAQLGEPFGRRGPEPEGVDGEDGVEGAVEGGRKLIDGGPDQGDPAGPDGSGVAPGRLPEHHFGMVDALYVTCAAARQAFLATLGLPASTGTRSRRRAWVCLRTL